jgi:predicted ATPase/DNA-binding CsgD family transcriptional regulator
VTFLTWVATSDRVPSARSRLFGREDEIADARHLLDGGARLVTITGAGGIGKTRIAVEVCRKISGKVSYLELSGTDEAGLPGALVRALVPEPGTGRDPVHSIATALIGEPQVVVLDTFERLLASVNLLDELLEACPDLQLLVTSRSRLRLKGENVVPIGGLPAGPDGPAVAMFYEHARAVGGLRAAGADDERAAVVALCELLDGSPMAIELAAARTTMFTPAALVAALLSGEQSRLRMLAGGNASGRHRDMRSAIAWSYLLLDEPAQRLLRQLAVFPGSFDLDAAALTCGEPAFEDAGANPANALDALADLVDWHLVEPVDGPADAPRFGLLDVLREFAAEQLRSRGEIRAAQESLLRWALDFAERAIEGTDSPAERRWLERIDRELPNLRAALNLLRERADAPRGARLAEAIGPFWAHRGPMSEGRAWFSAFLDLDLRDPKLSARGRAAATAWSVRLAIDEGKLDLEQLAAARSVLAEDPDAAIDWLRATEHLAYGLTMRGELDAADELTAAGIERATLADMPFWRCVFLQRRALSAQRHSRPELAVRYAQETVLAARAIGYDRIIARAEQVIAHEHANELGPEGTRLALLANLRAHEAAGDLRGVVSTMASLGAATVDTDVTAAARWLADGIDAGVRVGYWHGEAYCVVVTIVLLIKTGRLLDAVRLDDALQPYLPTLRASLPPAHYTGYRAVVDSARSRLDPAARDQAAGELTGGWPVVRDHAAAIVRRLASASEPAEPRVRRRGPSSNPELTDRELEVLAAIARGLTNPQIAAVLYLSPKTVMHHSTNVYRKLGVRGRAEAVALAYRTGLLAEADGLTAGLKLAVGRLPDGENAVRGEAGHVRAAGDDRRRALVNPHRGRDQRDRRRYQGRAGEQGEVKQRCVRLPVTAGRPRHHHVPRAQSWPPRAWPPCAWPPGGGGVRVGWLAVLTGHVLTGHVLAGAEQRAERGGPGGLAEREHLPDPGTIGGLGREIGQRG